tara:strand:- start:175 stop:762 length:588 start_codon:yes stop_codon:yes gene_type:complete
MSLTHTHAKQVTELQSTIVELGRINARQKNHTDRLVTDWISMKIEKELPCYDLGDQGEFEMRFGKSQIGVQCETEFDTGTVVGGSIGSRAEYICPGQVIPDFVEYLILCEQEEDNEDYWFRPEGFGEWYVTRVRLSGKARELRGKPTMLKWMAMIVTFQKIEQQECCVSGETYPVSQMVTNGEEWMYRGVWEAFE